MKKLLIVFVATLMLVVTGCGGGKKLECSMNVAGMDQKIVVEYDGDDVKTAKLVVGYKAEELADMGIDSSSMDVYVSTLEGAICPTYSSYEGTSCKVETPDGGVEVVVNLDYKKMSDTAKADLGFTNEAYDDMKKSFEDQGYTCK